MCTVGSLLRGDVHKALDNEMSAGVTVHQLASGPIEMKGKMEEGGVEAWAGVAPRPLPVVGAFRDGRAEVRERGRRDAPAVIGN